MQGNIDEPLTFEQWYNRKFPDTIMDPMDKLLYESAYGAGYDTGYQIGHEDGSEDGFKRGVLQVQEQGEHE
jgi:hypothetical protein